MTTKQTKIAEIAKANGYAVRIVAGINPTIFIDQPNGSIGIGAIGNVHQAWLSPKGWGYVHDITLTEALALITK